jgi:mannose-6-phosphate isomerase-like protein (cupin superfamily)
MKTTLFFVSLLVTVGLTASQPAPRPVNDAFVLERDAEVAKPAPGPHDGGGSTVGYSFFEKAPGYKTVFRKRVLQPGSAIGYHLQPVDEVFYILTGTGEMTINDQKMAVKAGDAILTRGGNSHGLAQRGTEPLALVIVYEKH